MGLSPALRWAPLTFLTVVAQYSATTTTAHHGVIAEAGLRLQLRCLVVANPGVVTCASLGSSDLCSGVANHRVVTVTLLWSQACNNQFSDFLNTSRNLKLHFKPLSALSNIKKKLKYFYSFKSFFPVKICWKIEVLRKFTCNL